MMITKLMLRLVRLMWAAGVVRLIGYVADAACLGAVIAWFMGTSPRYIGITLCIDAILFCIHGLIGEAIKRNTFKLATLAEELKQKVEAAE